MRHPTESQACFGCPLSGNFYHYWKMDGVFELFCGWQGQLGLSYSYFLSLAHL